MMHILKQKRGLKFELVGNADDKKYEPCLGMKKGENEKMIKGVQLKKLVCGEKTTRQDT